MNAVFPNPHAWPAALPAFLLAGHALAHVGVGEQVDYEQGESRERRTDEWAPRIASVSARMTQAQFDLFDGWFETDLQAGTRRFDARVADPGSAPAYAAWWAAQFIGPYRVSAASARYTVSAELLLLDGPYAVRVAPGLAARSVVRVADRLRGLSGGALRARSVVRAADAVRFAPERLRARSAVRVADRAALSAGADENALVLDDGQLFELDNGGNLLL